MEPRIQYAKTADGVSIAFWTLGTSADCVVLLPSLGRGGRDFDALAQALAQAGFRAVSVDPRGVGQSKGPLEGLTLHHLAADIVGVIEALDRGPIHVVGHAYGNRVARCLAADHRDLVRSVTLLAAGGLVRPEPSVSAALARCFQLDLPDEERLEAIRAAFFAPSSNPTVWREGWWPDAAAVQAAATRATPLEDWWEAGQAPLLVIQGLEDRTAPPANGHALRERLGERVHLVDLPSAGHALLPEQPKAIAEAIVAFLREHQKSGRRTRGRDAHDENIVPQCGPKWVSGSTLTDTDGVLSPPQRPRALQLPIVQRSVLDSGPSESQAAAVPVW